MNNNDFDNIFIELFEKFNNINTQMLYIQKLKWIDSTFVSNWLDEKFGPNNHLFWTKQHTLVIIEYIDYLINKKRNDELIINRNEIWNDLINNSELKSLIESIDNYMTKLRYS